MLTIITTTIPFILQALVIWYCVKMYLMIRPVRYWTTAWLLFAAAHTILLLRRGIGIFDALDGPSLPFWLAMLELAAQIAVSVAFLIGSIGLNRMYQKYFQNGIKVKSWKEEKAFNKKNGKNGKNGK